MNLSFPAQGVFLSADHLARWRDELRLIDDHVAQLNARRARLVTMLETARLFIEEASKSESHNLSNVENLHSKIAGVSPQLEEAMLHTDLEATWVDNVKNTIVKLDDGISPSQLKLAFAKSSLGDRIADSDKGFFHALSRLSERKEIIKHNGRYYSPKSYKVFLEKVRDGLVEDTPPTVVAYSPMATAIAKFVLRYPGCNSTNVINDLMKDPEFSAALSPRTTVAYNIIARMKKRGQMTVDGNKLFITAAGKRDLVHDVNDGNIQTDNMAVETASSLASVDGGSF